MYLCCQLLSAVLLTQLFLVNHRLHANISQIVFLYLCYPSLALLLGWLTMKDLNDNNTDDYVDNNTKWGQWVEVNRSPLLAGDMTGFETARPMLCV